jgi:hypothetical protein
MSPTASAGTRRVLIFHTDLAAADRALRAVRAAMLVRGDRRRIEPVLWSTALLEQAHWLRFAVADAAAADLCVLSLGSTDARANDAAAWLRELAPHLARHWISLDAPDETPALQAG